MDTLLFVSKNGLDKSDITTIMKYYLTAFNDEHVRICDGTVHKEVLSDADGLTPVTSSMQLYKGLVNYALNKNGNLIPVWPEGWMDLSVDQLAADFIKQ